MPLRSPERVVVGVALLLASLPLLAQQVDDALLLNDPAAIRVLLTAKLETTLSSQMTGTLRELQASLGQRVEADATLVQLNCTEAEARARVANAELAMTRQSLEAKRNLRKLDAVGDLEVAIAETEVQKADASRALASAQRSYCTVKAPFAGRVAKVHVKPFETVSAGTPLFDLVSDGPLKVRLNVPSRLVTRLSADMPLEVQILETGKRYAGHISAINSRVDAVAQTVELEAQLDAEHPELIAGMSGIATFPDLHD
ncbi:efflux RND transporter periplasmic adaptor subunit [Halopseudomonas maritima]|uniref:efflux RND transporter periplasmic adaptor subunit n=1 Tax=Halopseudomonas maritima TaxID=2918528 RepID=UPI001EE9FFC5|nr:efflux RND transporter periplasmic adaptor subunit [Halopseudomonas maritima]UJJ32714.1 efflux RND transporter periplasmic adaptor subunit [Halopseudomonas maritima]